MNTLDKSIDDLYQLPLADFTASRNALAKTLTGADAKRVKALAKPTVVPWAVNQVYWHARPVFDRVLTSGERLRSAQIASLEGRHADVRAASEAHRQAIADAVKQAERLSRGSGSMPAGDALMRTFETLSLASTRAEPLGRLTESLQPSGFEALAGVQVKASTVIVKEPTLAARAFPPGGPQRAALQADTRRQRTEREAAHRYEAAVKSAEATLAVVERAEQRARDAWERAHEQCVRP